MVYRFYMGVCKIVTKMDWNSNSKKFFRKQVWTNSTFKIKQVANHCLVLKGQLSPSASQWKPILGLRCFPGLPKK